jgi:nucleoside-triphosphatase
MPYHNKTGGRHILITGFPGIGKTTLVKRVLGELGEFHPVGFYTSEIREGGIRKGFELVSLDGRKGLLSHVGIKTPYRVGRYGVDVIAFEGFLGTLPFLDSSTNLIVIDEIGRMECFSPRFTGLVRELLDSGKVVITTVALKGGGLIEEVKKRKDVLTFLMTEGNRDSLVSEIVDTVRVMHVERRK